MRIPTSEISPPHDNEIRVKQICSNRFRGRAGRTNSSHEKMGVFYKITRECDSALRELQLLPIFPKSLTSCSTKNLALYSVRYTARTMHERVGKHHVTPQWRNDKNIICSLITLYCSLTPTCFNLFSVIDQQLTR